MRVVVVSKFDLDLKQKILDAGMKYSENKPEMVISLGGDGTFLRSERKYPGVPKLIAKDSKHCKKCAIKALDEKVLEKLTKGKYKVCEQIKLEAKILRDGKITRRYTCANDFTIRNRDQMRALRFYVDIGGKLVDSEMIGDGVVVATPFGSSGYFNSITRKKFKKGIGVAFNNTTKKVKPVVAKDDAKIKVKITRTEGVFSSDNDTQTFIMEEGDVAEIQKSDKKLYLVKV
jgi:NAD+ kinase